MTDIARPDVELAQVGEQVTPKEIATKRLLYAILAATMIPAAFELCLGWAIPRNAIASNFHSLLLFIAVAHVPLTLFFWIDKRYRGHMNENRPLYYGVPALIILACMALPLTFGEEGLNHLFVVYFMWLLWHYGRQNLGLLSFVSIGTQTPPVSPFERRLFDVACVAGLAGALSTYAPVKESILVPILPILYWTGLIVTAGVAMILCKVLLEHKKRGDPPLRLLMTALVCLFFVPSFNADVGIAPYAFAHAAQYFVIMYTLAGDRKQGNLVIRLGILTVMAIVGFHFASSLNSKAIFGDWVMVSAAIGTGITMSHFFLDSRLWRLREPFQRQSVKESFAFLFR